MDGTRIADALDRLVGALTGSVNVSALDIGSARTHFIPFESSITGTGVFDVWVPVGRRYVLRGYAISAVVNVALLPGATASGRFRFVDSGTTNCVAPVAVYGSTGSASSAIDVSMTGSQPLVVNLHEGIRGSVIGSKLQLDCSNDIGAGVIRFCGLVWGIEEEK